MNPRLLPMDFDQVFTGRVTYAPKVIVNASLEETADRLHARVIEGEDGLDHFSAIPLALRTDGGDSLKFALWRHRGNPDHTFAIHLPLDMENMGLPVLMILEALEIPRGAILSHDPELVRAGA